MTKKEMMQEFEENVLPYLNLNDRHEVIQEWGFYTDKACKLGEITESQYDSWSQPNFKGVRK